MGRDFGRYLQRLHESELVIFLFHGVIEDGDYEVRNYTRKHLDREDFREFVRDLKELGTPLSMDDVVEACESASELPPRSFAITFDDGFRNNLTVAAPVLADLCIPATFYVTTDFVDRNRQSWIDRIEWAVELTASGVVRVPWTPHAAELNSIASKRGFLNDVRANVKTRPDLDPDDFASAVQRQLGLPETWSTDDPLDAKMTWAQVVELNSDPLFSVAGHTHTHAILAHLPPADLNRELDVSIEMLRVKAGIRNSVHYSYPEGLAHCYSDSVIEALKARQIRCCPTAIDGTNTTETDLFHLKRVMVD